MTRHANFAFFFTAFLFLFFSGQRSYSLNLPDEYETMVGNSHGLGNGGVALSSGPSAVQSCPAMLAFDKRYEIFAGYHWPAKGREFYRAGVLDGKTAKVAAGVSYTGFSDDFQKPRTDVRLEENFQATLDSPIKRRVGVGIGYQLDNMTIGIGGGFIEAWNIRKNLGIAGAVEDEFIKGYTGYGGAAMAAGDRGRLAIGVENFANKKVADYAPLTYRGGYSYFLDPQLVLNVDYRYRERVSLFENQSPLRDESGKDRLSLLVDEKLPPEQLLIGSFMLRLKEVFEVLGSYGQSVGGGGETRRLVAGGVGISNQKISVSYTLSRPYMSDSNLNHQISLTLNMTM